MNDLAPPALSRRVFWGLLALGTIALCLYGSGLWQQQVVNPGGWPQLWRFLSASLQPDLSPDFLRLVLKSAFVTFAYAVCGTFLSVLLGMVGGVLASEIWWLAVSPHQSRQHFIWLGIRAVLAVPRAIHELIWGLFFINIFGLDPLVAILAIAIPYGAIVAKIFAEILDETPRPPLFALLNSGVAPLSAFSYSLIPQAFLNLLSYTFYRFECSIRSAAVLGIIGAGGLGYEMLLSLQSLRYSQLWTLFYALFLLNGAVDLSSALLRRRLGSPSRLDLNLRRRNLSARSARSAQTASPLISDSSIASPAVADSLAANSPAGHSSLQRSSLALRQPLGVGLAVVGVIVLCFWSIQADFSKLWSARTVTLLTEIGRSSLPPNFAMPLEDWLGLSLQTLAMSILAIAIAAVGGMLLAFPAAHNFFLPGGLLLSTENRPIGRIWAWGVLLLARAILLISRAIPAPIWALVALFVLFPGILPGAIALGLHNLGILGRLMAEVIENLDQRPPAALKAMGTPAALVFFYGILPLTATRFLAYVLYRWEVCMRETVVVGLVGAGGLGRLLTEQLSSFDYRSVVVTLGGFVILTFAVDWLSAQARRSLR